MRLVDADALLEALNNVPTVCCAGCRYWRKTPLSEAYGYCDSVVTSEDRASMTSGTFGCAYFDAQKEPVPLVPAAPRDDEAEVERLERALRAAREEWLLARREIERLRAIIESRCADKGEGG